MGITFKRIIWCGEVYHGSYQFSTSLHIQKCHILASLWLSDTGVSCMKCAPPVLRISEWLRAHTPFDVLDVFVCQHCKTSLCREGHGPIEIEAERAAGIVTDTCNPALHQWACRRLIDSCTIASEELEWRINTRTRFPIPVYEQACVA